LHESEDARTSPVETVSALILAIDEDRIEDVQRLVHPQVVWRALARPGKSQYRGRDGMVSFLADLRAAYGTYRVEIDDITEDPDGHVVVLAHVVQQTESGDRALPPARSSFTLLDGLVVAMEADPANGGG
jgi:limonene-1,2-epoxide hydrolase